jgi:hypothetical protein
MKSHITTWDKALQHFTDKVGLRTGAVRKVYNADLKSRVTELDGLVDGGRYLCTGAEAVDKTHLPAGLSA